MYKLYVQQKTFMLSSRLKLERTSSHIIWMEKVDIAFVNSILIKKTIPDEIIQEILEYLFVYW